MKAEIEAAVHKGMLKVIEWGIPLLIFGGLFSWLVVDYMNTRARTIVMWNYLGQQQEQAAKVKPSPAASPVESPKP